VYLAPAFANGTVYAGDASGVMFALNGHNGALNWTYTAGSFIRGVAVANGVVYFTTGDSILHALAASYGGELAAFAPGAQYLGSPAISDGVVYASANAGNTIAYSLNGGNQVFAKPKPLSLSLLHPNFSLPMSLSQSHGNPAKSGDRE
jgi:outer membrane protein assembly factor BamB